jgi:hypothetical protein
MCDAAYQAGSDTCGAVSRPPTTYLTTYQVDQWSLRSKSHGRRAGMCALTGGFPGRPLWFVASVEAGGACAWRGLDDLGEGSVRADQRPDANLRPSGWWGCCGGAATRVSRPGCRLPRRGRSRLPPKKEKSK